MMKKVGEEPYLKARGKALECERLGAKPCTSMGAWRSKPIDGVNTQNEPKLRFGNLKNKLMYFTNVINRSCKFINFD
jgi:hypothetical protein